MSSFPTAFILPFFRSGFCWKCPERGLNWQQKKSSPEDFEEKLAFLFSNLMASSALLAVVIPREKEKTSWKREREKERERERERGWNWERDRNDFDINTFWRETHLLEGEKSVLKSLFSLSCPPGRKRKQWKEKKGWVLRLWNETCFNVCRFVEGGATYHWALLTSLVIDVIKASQIALLMAPKAEIMVDCLAPKIYCSSKP